MGVRFLSLAHIETRRLFGTQGERLYGVTTQLFVCQREVRTDRANDLTLQPMRKQKNVRESWEAKLEGYEELIETRLFRRLFELPEERTGALVCALTVDASNANAMVRVKPGKPWFLVQAHPAFGYSFAPPRQLLDVYGTPWLRDQHAPYVFTTAGSSRDAR